MSNALQLYTFSGIRPAPMWDIRRLDDLYRPLHPDEIRQVRLVDVAEDRARDRAERSGWLRLRLLESRPLARSELRDGLITELIRVPRLDLAWMSVVSALDRATLRRLPASSVELRFLPWWWNYLGEHALRCVITTKDDGEVSVTISGPELLEKTTPLEGELSDLGWSVPMGPRQTGITQRLSSTHSVGWAALKALRALTLLYPVSSRDFVRVWGTSVVEPRALDTLQKVQHGELTYYHPHCSGAEFAEYRAMLQSTPLPPPKLDSQLTPEAQARFIAAWKSTPGIHDWLDEDILYAMFHGG